MSDFSYKASVIVPVYNVEDFVEKAIYSLINQDMDFSEIQVILVNDGSTDSSEEKCKQFADLYPNIFLYSKENEGLSKTRNYGLNFANGKYIFYLDSDDTLKENTIREVTSFFDTVYDEVDLVSYPIIQYYNNKPKLIHYRYKFLENSGIYDLTDKKNCFITQTTVNVCVKNKGDNCIKFDTTPEFRHEDEKYNCDIIAEKMRIGFCNKGEYKYNRNNENSIVSSQYTAENIFETSTNFYEELFSKYKTVPYYFQGIVFNDFRWIMKENRFLPLHLEGEEWVRANKRIDELLRKIDEDIIVLHPSVNEYHMHYWLKRKPDSHPIVLAGKDNILIICSGRTLYNTDKLKITGTDNLTIKSPIFFHLKRSQFDVFMRINNEEKKVDIDFNDDYLDKSNSCVENFFPTFKKTENTEYFIKINGVMYKLK